MAEHVGGAFDQAVYRGYIPQMAAYPATSVNVDTLRAAFATVIAATPSLAGTLFEDATGRIRLAPSTQPAKVDDFFEVVEVPDFDYIAWRGRRFPVPEFLTVFKDAYPPPQTYPTYIIKARLTIMKGGVALCIWFHHCALDAGGAAQFWSALAAASRGDLIPKLTMYPRIAVHTGDPPADHAISSHPAYTIAPDVRGVFPPGVVTRLHFSDASLATLKAELSLHLPPGQWISTLDALNALIWSSIGKANGRGDSLDLAIPVEARSRMQPPIPTTYLGNCFYLVVARSPGPSVTERALAIRSAINALSSDTLDHLSSVVSQYPRLYEWHGHLDGPYLITSWASLPYGVLNWADDVFGGARCERITEPLVLRSGMGIILPRIPGGVDIDLSLEPAHMDILLADEQVRRFALWDGGYIGVADFDCRYPAP